MYFNRFSTGLIRALLSASLIGVLAACGGNSSGVTGTTSSVSGTSSSGTTGGGGGATGGTTTGSITLQWTAPVTRSDGTPLQLSEISGYRVYYGTSPGNYPNSIKITNGSLQSATLNGIPVGSYYVAMTTLDTSGLESSYSAAIVKKSL